MKLGDYWRMAWDQLKRRKVVTAMCAMGIAIGSASIIVALAFGESVTHYTQQQMSYYLKADEMTVVSGTNRGPGPTRQIDESEDVSVYAITEAKLDLIRGLPHVLAAASYRNVGYHWFQIDGTKRGQLELIATELDTLQALGMEFQQGEAADIDNAIILNYGAAYGLVDEESLQQSSSSNVMMPDLYSNSIAYPVYQKQILLQIDIPGRDNADPLEIPVRVIGVLKEPEGAMPYMVYNSKQGYISPELGLRISEELANLTTDENSGGQPSYEINEIKVKAEDAEYIPQLEQWIGQLRLTAYSNLDQIKQMEGEFAIVRILLGGAGLFVLLIASLSIVVAMTMSTYQRRRQIGIMKVLGANLRQIRNMFIVESTLLGLLGGLVGVLLSYWVIWGINILIVQLSDSPPGGSNPEVLFISLWIIPIGLMFAALTGIFSGIYPALKAAKTDALTAIKRE
ncbi:ABC transporter permease [Paenibacillus senegalensis]|uniref:ABC transporter permease n=1 Tax=Paenibacillus senegalensis TaxID=1465766 RepID=UPI000288265A|nr:ABC transporter permease [Paenibacillus senegalensis]